MNSQPAPRYALAIECDSSGPEIEYVAYAVELGKGACCGIGQTVGDAISDYLENKDVYLHQLAAAGIALPQRRAVPIGLVLGGNVTVRPPPYLPTELADRHVSHDVCSPADSPPEKRTSTCGHPSQPRPAR